MCRIALFVALLTALSSTVIAAPTFFTETFDTDVSSLWEVGQRQWNFDSDPSVNTNEVNTLLRPIVTSTPGWTGTTLTAPVPNGNYPTADNTPRYRTNYLAVNKALDGGNVYANKLWGNLGNADLISATFRLSSSLADGTAFARPDFWKMYPAPGADANPAHFRFFFIGDVHAANDTTRTYSLPYTADPSTPGHYYDFWYSKPLSPAYANFVTGFTGGMLDNVYATLSAPMNDPTQWTSGNGLTATFEPSVLAEFNEARADVIMVGITMGGGNYFVNGFSFVDGGPTGGAMELDSFTIIPEPTSAALLATGAGLLLRRRRECLP